MQSALNPVDDIKVLFNDWPYGVDQKIVHLVVWTKFPLVEDPATGDLKKDARKQIDDFVNMTFVGHMKSQEHVSWKLGREFASGAELCKRYSGLRTGRR